MTGSIEKPEISFRGRTPPIETDLIDRIFDRLHRHDLPDRYSFVVEGDEADPEEAADAVLGYSDHVPASFDVTEADPHLFRATAVNDRITVELKTDSDRIDDFRPLLDIILEETTLQVGIENDQTLHAWVETDYIVELEDIDTPSGWMSATQPSEIGSRVKLSLFDGFTLEETSDQLQESLAAVDQALAGVRKSLETKPTTDSPVDPVREFYEITINPELDDPAEMVRFVRQLAHSRGFYAQMEEVDPKKDTELVSLETEVYLEDLDESVVSRWFEEHPAPQLFIGEDDIAAIGNSDGVAIIRTTLTLESNGDIEEQKNEHLVATEHGEWKLVR